MTIPRAIGILGALVIGVLAFGRRDIGLHFDHWKLGLKITAMSLFIGSLGELFRLHGGYDATMRWWLFFSVTTAFVAFFEEIYFRGALLRSLQEVVGPRVAALISSAMFMLYHLGAQPLSSFPDLFLFGAFAAFARIAGLGLGWLILEHWVYDVLMLAGFGFYSTVEWMAAIQLILAFGLAWYCWRQTGLTPFFTHRRIRIAGIGFIGLFCLRMAIGIVHAPYLEKQAHTIWKKNYQAYIQAPSFYRESERELKTLFGVWSVEIGPDEAWVSVSAWTGAHSTFYFPERKAVAPGKQGK
ncbi:MAG: CPBP family intramembrane metalloprotease [Deltaproteobacteria bacterium]|nr:CPBP family intramembrane metalloprotease [Deltaproteobacteria bacterium]